MIALWPLMAAAVTIDARYPHIGTLEGIALVPNPVIIKESAKVDRETLASTAPPASGVSVYTSLVQQTFGTSSPMIAVAKCESGIRQFRASGEVLMGGGGDNYIGIFQIGRSWVPIALSMGMDVYTAEGNVAFAKYLYDEEGLSQWECAFKLRLI